MLAYDWAPLARRREIRILHRPALLAARTGASRAALQRLSHASFFRVDVRLEKRWPLGKTGSLALVVEGQNVTLSKEVSNSDLHCMGSAGMPTRCTYGRVGPITIPSLGLEAFF